MRVVFILPGRGGGGGAHSVVQEALGLRRMGLEVTVASTRAEHGAFRSHYPELERTGVRNPVFDDTASLKAALADHDLAIATTAPSAHLLAQALEEMPAGARPRPGYYVQDYEPLFFRPGTEEWRAARSSYTVNAGALLMAKTDWLCAMVDENHNVGVERVQASVDHGVYFPDLREAREGVTISAMIRPKTPRRAPKRTVRILERLAAEFGADLRVTSFGCDRADLDADGLKLSAAVEHLGVLSRAQVASTLRATDLFLDLSDYQAFGRTGLEGMACGCVPVLPLFGGAAEYAQNRQNAFVVDTRSDEAVLGAVREFMADDSAARAKMRMNALETAHRYSIETAAFSEYKVFSAYLGG